jgi:hypothetical protein
MNTNELKELNSLIKSSFSNTQYPGDDCIVDGAFPPQMPDNKEIYDLYYKKLWMALDDDFFFSNGFIQFSINFLTKKSFLYYLPAFMLHIISPKWNWTTGCLIDGLFYELSPDSILNNNCNKFTELKKLNDAQLRCITRFLEFICSHKEKYGEEVVAASIILLEKYWNKL